MVRVKEETWGIEFNLSKNTGPTTQNESRNKDCSSYH